MTFGNLMKGLKIFEKYIDPDDYPFCAEHVIVYINIDNSLLSEEEKKELDNLGFYFDLENCKFFV
jgi:hypothetical protein